MKSRCARTSNLSIWMLLSPCHGILLNNTVKRKKLRWIVGTTIGTARLILAMKMHFIAAYMLWGDSAAIATECSQCILAGLPYTRRNCAGSNFCKQNKLNSVTLCNCITHSICTLQYSASSLHCRLQQNTFARNSKTKATIMPGLKYMQNTYCMVHFVS